MKVPIRQTNSGSEKEKGGEKREKHIPHGMRNQDHADGRLEDGILRPVFALDANYLFLKPFAERVDAGGEVAAGFVFGVDAGLHGEAWVFDCDMIAKVLCALLESARTR